MLPHDAGPPPPTEQLIFYDTSVVYEIKQEASDQKKGQHLYENDATTILESSHRPSVHAVLTCNGVVPYTSFARQIKIEHNQSEAHCGSMIFLPAGTDQGAPLLAAAPDGVMLAASPAGSPEVYMFSRQQQGRSQSEIPEAVFDPRLEAKSPVGSETDTISLAWSSDSSRLAVATAEGHVMLIDRCASV